MRSMPITTHALASTLAAAIAEGRPIVGLTIGGPLPPSALDIVAEIAATLDDLVATLRPLTSTPGASLTEMLTRAYAQGRFADTGRDVLVPLLDALEAAGVTLDLRPGLVPVDPSFDPEPDATGTPTGLEIRIWPRPGRVAH